MKAKVITFTKATGAAPASQAVTGVGFTPRAIIFIWGGATADNTVRNSVWGGIGYVGKDVSNAINGYSAAWSSQNGAATQNTSRRIANKAISIIEYSESVNAECDMTSLDSDGFTLNWTTNSGTAHKITALCLGGADLTAAKAFTWATPGATGSQAVTGIGFQPECLFTARTNSGLGSSTASGALSIGVSDGTNSALVGLFDNDAEAVASSVSRGQRTGQIVGSIDSAASWTTLASLTSFDSDGFTLNWSARTNTNACIGLALNGGSYKVGTTAKSNSISIPVTQAVTGVGFRPVAIMNLSVFGGTLTGAGTVTVPLSLGASDGSNSQAHAMRSEDNVGTSDAASYYSTSKAIVKLDDTSNGIDAEASIALDSGGFTWTWTDNDIATSNIGWVAFGPPDQVFGNTQVIMAA